MVQRFQQAPALFVVILLSQIVCTNDLVKRPLDASVLGFASGAYSHMFDPFANPVWFVRLQR
jgi:hypothetical protein